MNASSSQATPGTNPRETTWRERALNAESALKSANNEIRAHRERIGELLDLIRDLEAVWTKESIELITSRNTTLEHSVRKLAADNHALEEQLKLAQSKLRFQDRRIANLETQLTDQEATSNPQTGR